MGWNPPKKILRFGEVPEAEREPLQRPRDRATPRPRAERLLRARLGPRGGAIHGVSQLGGGRGGDPRGQGFVSGLVSHHLQPYLLELISPVE